MIIILKLLSNTVTHKILISCPLALHPFPFAGNWSSTIPFPCNYGFLQFCTGPFPYLWARSPGAEWVALTINRHFLDFGARLLVRPFFFTHKTSQHPFFHNSFYLHLVTPFISFQFLSTLLVRNHVTIFEI